MKHLMNSLLGMMIMVGIMLTYNHLTSNSCSPLYAGWRLDFTYQERENRRIDAAQRFLSMQSSMPCLLEGLQGPCRWGRIERLADGVTWGPCRQTFFPEREYPNYQDDDCDGEVDEVDGDLGEPEIVPEREVVTYDMLYGNTAIEQIKCETYLPGVCYYGFKRMFPDDSFGPCIPWIPPDSNEEICNGADDNCDGVVDEGCPSSNP